MIKNTIILLSLVGCFGLSYCTKSTISSEGDCPIPKIDRYHEIMIVNAETQIVSQEDLVLDLIYICDSTLMTTLQGFTSDTLLLDASNEMLSFRQTEYIYPCETYTEGNLILINDSIYFDLKYVNCGNGFEPGYTINYEGNGVKS